VICGRLPGRRALLFAVLPWLLAPIGCARSVEGGASPGPPASDLPSSVEELEELIVEQVPSGLPRVPDDELHPPAGAKRLEDIAHYADDPAREREVLEEFGYRFGWERFWGRDSASLTGVFVDQFESRAGAGTYAADLAGNDAEHYDAVLHADPEDLPGGCEMLTVEDAQPEAELAGPTAFVWCAHGVFSVGVTAVGDTAEDAEEQVRAVLEEQLDRLPPM
jgi:hypothetical protein